MLLKSDPVNAFMAYDPIDVPHAPKGPLSGLTIAVKDLFDVTGYRSGWGSPTRLAEAPIAEETAPIVAQCLDAGARFVGKTITDEFAYSLNGQNAHYGTPVNTRAPGRIPGGSSSGSASAVAAGLVDFAIGSDTGGSVRAPASYNGVYGLRPSHGRLPLDGCMPLAPLYDTPSWFARDIAVYIRVADVLLGHDGFAYTPDKLLYPTDMWALLEDTVLPSLANPLERVSAATHDRQDFDLLASVCTVQELFKAFRLTQGYEIWQVFGDWMTEKQPDLGPGVKERFEFASNVSEEDYEWASEVRERVRNHVRSVVTKDTVMVLPTVPDAAPHDSMPIEQLEAFRNRALTLLCISGMSGIPQFSLPLGEHDGMPIGISILGPHGSDRNLISLGAKIAGVH